VTFKATGTRAAAEATTVLGTTVAGSVSAEQPGPRDGGLGLLPLGPIFKPGTLAPTEVWPGGIVTTNEEPPPPEEPTRAGGATVGGATRAGGAIAAGGPSPAETAQLAAEQAAANARASNRAAERAQDNFDDVERLAPSSGKTREQQDAAIARAEADASKAK
jgi:hypothetical protein